jgi:hypothetical protein
MWLCLCRRYGLIFKGRRVTVSPSKVMWKMKKVENAVESMCSWSEGKWASLLCVGEAPCGGR